MKKVLFGLNDMNYDGNLRSTITKDIEKYGLRDYVILLVSKINLYPYLKNSDLYVQTSRYKRYCISLAEARMHALPIANTDFAGAKEQLINKINGSVVSVNMNHIYEEVLQLINNVDIRNRYRDNLKKGHSE